MGAKGGRMYVYRSSRRGSRLGTIWWLNPFGDTTPPPPPGIPPVVQADTGIVASLKNDVVHALRYWAGDKTGGPLTENEITRTIQSCQQDVIKASRGLTAAQITAGMQRCQTDIAAISSLPSLYTPDVVPPGNPSLATYLVYGGLFVGALFILSR